MRVLGISGSLRRDSLNTRLLRAAATRLPSGAELVELDPAALKAVPAYDPDDEVAAPPAPVAALRAAIADADAILVATPEYNGTIPGQLKNAVDWASRPRGDAALRNTPAAVIGASPGMFGAAWAQADLRKALGVAGARVVDRELPVAGADEALGADGLPLDPELLAELDGILADLVALARHRAEVRAIAA